MKPLDWIVLLLAVLVVLGLVIVYFLINPQLLSNAYFDPSPLLGGHALT